MKSLPIIYSAHHASHDFGDFSARCALSQDQRKRYCDLGTELSLPRNGIISMVARASRGLVDLNRPVGHEAFFPWKDFGRPKSHEIWLPGKEPTFAERKKLQSDLYDAYHERIDGMLIQQCARGEDTLVVAWDNTADYVIGKDHFGNDVRMPDIILSNNGDEGSVAGQSMSCDGDFLLALGSQFSNELQIEDLPCDVHYNEIFRGGHITQHYTNFTNKESSYSGARISSLQVEYNMAITHDQKNLEENIQAIKKLQKAFERAIEKVIDVSSSVTS